MASSAASSAAAQSRESAAEGDFGGADGGFVDIDVSDSDLSSHGLNERSGLNGCLPDASAGIGRTDVAVRGMASFETVGGADGGMEGRVGAATDRPARVPGGDAADRHSFGRPVAAAATPAAATVPGHPSAEGWVEVELAAAAPAKPADGAAAGAAGSGAVAAPPAPLQQQQPQRAGKAVRLTKSLGWRGTKGALHGDSGSTGTSNAVGGKDGSKTASRDAASSSALAKPSAGAAAASGKLTAEEDRARGSVSLSLYSSYLGAFGGVILAVSAATLLTSTVGYVGTDWWLSYWSSGGSASTSGGGAGGADTHSIGYYIGVYAALTLATIALVFAQALAWAVGGVRAAQHLHAAALQRVLRSPMAFFDATPLGR
jgi:hypothetical protein